METLPIVLLTKDRTGCACATVDALLSNLGAYGYSPRHIVCDDMSVPGHVEAVVAVYRRHGVEPVVHVTTDGRHGLGASMNIGLEDAFSDPGATKCLRLEDDWMLDRPLDIGPWVAKMDRLWIGSLRLGMMYRHGNELTPFQGSPDLMKVRSAYHQLFTFNNQVAVVTRELTDLIGKYPENVKPSDAERTAAYRHNHATGYGSMPPYVAWPSGWDTFSQYGRNLPFVHIGVSLSGHSKMYRIPARYMKFNDPAEDRRLRAEALG